MTTISPAPLLVVEDSNADFHMLKRLMRKMDVKSPIYRCATGDEALEFLYKKGLYQDDDTIVSPGVIMLDLNLPGTDGRAVLTKLKQDKDFNKIPIVVFTTSSAPSDIDFCYQQGANGYLVKPVDAKELARKVQAFVDYWLGSNTSPFSILS